MAVALAVRLTGLMRAGDRRGDPQLARAWLGFAVLAVLGFASLFDYGYGYGYGERAKEHADEG
jgi:hypothetical protein